MVVLTKLFNDSNWQLFYTIILKLSLGFPLIFIENSIMKTVKFSIVFAN